MIKANHNPNFNLSCLCAHCECNFKLFEPRRTWRAIAVVFSTLGAGIFLKTVSYIAHYRA